MAPHQRDKPSSKLVEFFPKLFYVILVLYRGFNNCMISHNFYPNHPIFLHRYIQISAISVTFRNSASACPYNLFLRVISEHWIFTKIWRLRLGPLKFCNYVNNHILFKVRNAISPKNTKLHPKLDWLCFRFLAALVFSSRRPKERKAPWSFRPAGALQC